MLSLLSCARNPVTLERELMFFGDEKEIKIGEKADKEVIKKYGYYPDKNLQQYIDSVGQKLARICDRNYLTYHFKVVDLPVLNAFALPGGFIYITRGLVGFLNSEAELAGVLGHEIGHVVERDGINQLSKIMTYRALSLVALAKAPQSLEYLAISNLLFTSIFQGYSRQKEFRADMFAVKYMYKAGYDPRELIKFMRRMLKKHPGPIGYEVYLASHPNMAERVGRVAAEMKVEIAMDRARDIKQRKLFVGEDVYKSHLDGLIYGPKNSPYCIKIYTVRFGDTLYSISERFYHSRDDAEHIADFNGIDMETPLYPGQKLKLIIKRKYLKLEQTKPF